MMRSLANVLWLVAAVAVVHGVQACSVENDPGAELNPQPLPPEDPSAPGEGLENDDVGRGGGSTSSSGGPAANADSDGGTPDGGDGGDARDAGEGG